MAECGGCKARAAALNRGVQAVVRGDLRAAASSAGFVVKTFAQDARSGALRTAAANQYAKIKAAVPTKFR